MEPLQARRITKEELCITEYLVRNAKVKTKQLVIPEKVYVLNDGGMGNIRFIGDDSEKRYGSDLIEAKYTDSDGVSVMIALQLNINDELLDLDF